MTRAEIFKKEENERLNKTLAEEIRIRSKAARALSEPFDIGGVEIEPGVDYNGEIRVRHGLDILAASIGEEIVTEDEQSGKNLFTYKRINVNGAVFCELVSCREVVADVQMY